MNENEWRELVSRAAGGDDKAFEGLYKESAKAVYFTSLKLTANEHTAKDITQESFLAAYSSLDKLQDGAKFQSWVCSIAVNKCKMHFRRRNDQSLDEQQEPGGEIADDSFIPEDYVTNEEKRRIIMQLIDNELPEEQRQTVILFYYNQLTTAQIAELMGCPEGTVKYRLYSAREKLREAVLMYEKKNDDRLHGTIALPVIKRILDKEAEGVSLPKISPMPAKTTSPDTNTLKKAGESSMKKALTAKIAAAAAAVVAAGAGAALYMNANNDNDKTALKTDSSSSAVSIQESSSDNAREQESKEDAPAESTDNSSAAAEQAIPLEGLTKRGTIEFGHWEQDGDESNGAEPIVWRIYEMKDGRAYLWSHMVLDYAPFSSSKATWENSDIREWLNGEFYQNAFTDEEKTHIFLSEIDNEADPATLDHVFLPTPADAEPERFHQDHSQEMSPAAQKKYLELTGKESKSAKYWSRIVSPNNGKPEYIYTITDTDDPAQPYGIIPCIYVAYDETKA